MGMSQNKTFDFSGDEFQKWSTKPSFGAIHTSEAFWHFIGPSKKLDQDQCFHRLYFIFFEIFLHSVRPIVRSVQGLVWVKIGILLDSLVQRRCVFADVEIHQTLATELLTRNIPISSDIYLQRQQFIRPRTGPELSISRY